MKKMRNAECGMRNAPANHRRSAAAFTMIEIAISLAVIGFALVAIISILPIGMSAQKSNREKTIITQDANVFMDAIRYGQQGLDDLTNYVTAITNSATRYNILPSGGLLKVMQWTSWYTYAGSGSTFPTAPQAYPITNGYRIVGLLSTPKYFFLGPPAQPTGFFSNHVVALVRSLSGNASDKFPQNNTNIQDLAFSYRLISDVVPYTGYDTNWVYFQQQSPLLSTNDYVSRSNTLMTLKNFQNNAHDVRLNFRWPLLANGDVSDRSPSQVFRAMAGGLLLRTNEGAAFNLPPTWVFFFQPRTYVKAP
jgi:type II secretory pathway pseudopilin PulG